MISQLNFQLLGVGFVGLRLYLPGFSENGPPPTGPQSHCHRIIINHRHHLHHSEMECISHFLVQKMLKSRIIVGFPSYLPPRSLPMSPWLSSIFAPRTPRQTTSAAPLRRQWRGPASAAAPGPCRTCRASPGWDPKFNGLT